uniref:Si:dkey-30c15.2 n=1 Tax=Cyprinus carpio TaxID=7962 RepID=A0A8C2FJH6_CYPCA
DFITSFITLLHSRFIILTSFSFFCSLIGSCSVVVVSIIKRRHLNEQAKPLLQLALADFLASLVLMITAIMNLPNEIWPFSEEMCNLGLPLSLAFYCVSFLLVIIYACESAHAFQGWREKPIQEAFETQVSRVTIPTLTTVSRGPTARFCNSCILFLHLINDSCITVDPGHAEFIQIFTLSSVLIVIIICTLVYCKLESSYRHYENTRMITMTQRHPGGIWSSARYMILVVIFCWAPALLLICLSFIQLKIKYLFPLYVTQALSVSLQGFLNSIVYAWRRRNFRDAVLGERLPLMAYSNRAFFDQSLNEPCVITNYRKCYIFCCLQNSSLLEMYKPIAEFQKGKLLADYFQTILSPYLQE